ncbi:MAG: serine hydrolase domain-containing protein, partial [Saprospiraceae bacterium]|nr:serine hydrolase domain-containing protein [Saprospiraceae bacterium]
MRNLLFLLTLLLLSCQSSTGVKTAEQSAPLTRLEASIDSLFHAHIAGDEPGAAVLIAVNGEALIKKGFGLRDLRTKAPITPTTNMRLASVSKQFTALTVLSLVDQGLVALDDTVSKYLPYPAFDNVTIQQFLNHSSGIANYDHYLNNWDQPRIAENRDLLAWYAEENPAPGFAPG